MIFLPSFSTVSLGQTAARLLFSLEKCRQSPDQFQRICIVAFSTLRAINFQYGLSLVPDLLSTLEEMPALDFYGFFRIPHQFLFPYRADRIDADKLLDHLKKQLSLNDGECEKKRLIEQKVLAFLEKMEREEVAFSSEEDFKGALASFLKRPGDGEARAIFLVSCHLKNFEVPLIHLSLVQQMTHAAFIAADLFCVPDFLQNWDLIDLSAAAKSIGGGVVWTISKDFFGQLTWAALFCGYFLQLMQALEELIAIKLGQERTEDEKKAARWIAVASLAECVYSAVNLSQQADPLVNLCALVAKSLGAVAFFYQD